MATGIAPTTPWYRSRGGVTLLALIGIALLALLFWAPWARNRAPQPQTAQATSAQQAALAAPPTAPQAPATTTQATVPVQSVPAGFMLVADPAGNPVLVASPAPAIPLTPAAATPAVAPATPQATKDVTTTVTQVRPGGTAVYVKSSGPVAPPAPNVTALQAGGTYLVPIGQPVAPITAPTTPLTDWQMAWPYLWVLVIGGTAAALIVWLVRRNTSREIAKQGDGLKAFLGGEGDGAQSLFAEEVMPDGTRSTYFRGRARIKEEFTGGREAAGASLSDRLAEKGFDTLTRLAERTGVAAPTATAATPTTGPQAPATAAQVQGVKKGVDGVSTRLAALEKQFAGKPA